MFAGRAAVAGPSAVKGGKFTVEELYGFTKKPHHATRSGAGGGGGAAGAVEDHREWKQRQRERQKEESAFASQVLEQARRLMERRRLELYLNECQLSLKDCTAEHTPMSYRYLGKSGLRVSCLGLGTWVTFGSQISDETAECVVTTAYNSGVNLFDTAEVYASGRAETTLGKILKRKGWGRSSYVVTTKIYWGGPAETERGLSRKHIIEGLRASLSRLQLDYVDIVFANRNDINSPMEEVVRAMTFVIEQGMAMYWGTSRWNVIEIMEAYAVARQFNLIAPVCEQSEYHYFQRDKIERQLPDLYHKIGVGVMAWSPLACCLLTGKYEEGIPDGSRAAMKGYSWLKDKVCSDEWKKHLSKVRDLRLIAERLNCTPAQLAIAWCLRSEGVSTVLLGATNSEQLLENVGSMKVLSQLTPPIIAEMDTLLGNKPRNTRKESRP